jgi:hypothetical protein
MRAIWLHSTLLREKLIKAKSFKPKASSCDKEERRRSGSFFSLQKKLLIRFKIVILIEIYPLIAQP